MPPDPIGYLTALAVSLLCPSNPLARAVLAPCGRCAPPMPPDPIGLP